MQKKLIAVFTIIVMIVCCMASACGGKERAPDPMEGFRTSGRVSGGTLQENVNARTLSVSEAGEDVRIEFSFIAGSRISGGTEESALSELPSYTVYLLTSPSRLVVEFDSLAYWDYSHDLVLENELIYGCFQQNLYGSPGVSIYFQLSDDVGFSVVEGEGSVSILLRRTPDESNTDAKVHYYATTNAYQEYCSGLITREYDVTPVLCRNFTDVVLISPAYDTQAEAEGFRNAAIAASTDLLPEQWEIIALYHNDLPIYNEELDYQQTYAQQVLRRDGETMSLPVLLEDGLYLTTAPDGSILYGKVFREGELGEDAYAYEELWIRHQDDSTRRMLRFEFAAIEQCSYSPDGRKLAVLERADEGSHLYIFDADTNDLLTDLAEVGFGDMIGAFTWNDLGNIIYAVSGSAGMKVNQYDFTISEETKRHSIVDKNGADEGSIGFYDGEVYFTESSMENGSVIYRIKPEGGVRKAFGEGSVFQFSPDNRHLAVTNSGMDLVGEGKTSAPEFGILDLETGDELLITSEFPVYDFFWSQDGSRLFYFENRLTGGGSEGTEMGKDTGNAEDTEESELAGEGESTQTELDPYPYSLHMYDLASGESILVAELSSTAVFPAPDADVLYIPYYDKETMGALVRATYEFNIKETE